MDVARRIGEVMDIDHAAPALCYEARWWTWGACAELGSELDALLADRVPPKPGTPVAVVMRNRPAHVATILHVLRRRYCLVPISSIQSTGRIADDVRAQRPPVVLADAEDWSDDLIRATRDCDALGIRVANARLDVVVAGGGDPGGDTLRDGTAVWMPTSGTTGPPKRIPIGYQDLDIGFDRVRRYAGANERAASAARLSSGVVISCTPLVHIAGLWEVFQFAVEGRRLVLLDRFEPAAWADAVAESGPRVTMLPPTALAMLLESDVAAAKLGSLRAILCGTAALNPDVEERFSRHFGTPVLTTYGATEFPGGLAGWSLQDKNEFGAAKRGSVGRPRPGITLRVVDEQTGNPVGPGADGVIEVQSAQTAARGIEGFVRTTDLGRIDDDGFVWITGRADGAINRGGFKVLPETVESALLRHPAVRSAGVVGLPDPRLGHVPAAGVEVRTPVTEDELREWLRERLLKYQVPVRIVIVDSLPKTPSMKVSKPKLLDLLTEHR